MDDCDMAEIADEAEVEEEEEADFTEINKASSTVSDKLYPGWTGLRRCKHSSPCVRALCARALFPASRRRNGRQAVKKCDAISPEGCFVVVPNRVRRVGLLETKYQNNERTSGVFAKGILLRQWSL